MCDCTCRRLARTTSALVRNASLARRTAAGADRFSATVYFMVMLTLSGITWNQVLPGASLIGVPSAAVNRGGAVLSAVQVPSRRWPLRNTETRPAAAEVDVVRRASELVAAARDVPRPQHDDVVGSDLLVGRRRRCASCRRSRGSSASSASLYVHVTLLAYENGIVTLVIGGRGGRMPRRELQPRHIVGDRHPPLRRLGVGLPRVQVEVVRRAARTRARVRRRHARVLREVRKLGALRRRC